MLLKPTFPKLSMSRPYIHGACLLTVAVLLSSCDLGALKSLTTEEPKKMCEIKNERSGIPIIPREDNATSWGLCVRLASLVHSGNIEGCMKEGTERFGPVTGTFTALAYCSELGTIAKELKKLESK